MVKRECGEIRDENYVQSFDVETSWKTSICDIEKQMGG
jgi:hypothetical protein